MSNTERKKILNYRTASGILPNPNNIDYGEIAIGYKKDNEAIYIKNSTDEIVDFTPISIVNITYNELKELRNNSKLKPSQHYRITDFVTTVTNDPEARSAGHPFDIIVMASDKNKLQEECYAIQHEGDTYFAKCNLAAWKIWYCLDNDTTKYMWADTANGKGVIYRMIDEWQNDCPYDFKNVQFKRYAVKDASPNGELASLNGTYIGYNSKMKGLNIPDQSDFKWAYTFSIGSRLEVPGDASIIGYNSTDIGEGYGRKGYYGDNTIKPSSSRTLIDNIVYSVFCLNNIVWWTNNTKYRSLINGNRIESECSNMTLSGYGTIIEHDCLNFIMGDRCYGNSFKSGCGSNTFGNDCQFNTFGNRCYDNTFGNGCYDNTFGNYCATNTFGNNCNSNIFGNYCNSNTFGSSCNGNSFGNDCETNTFGINCCYNTFGNSCNLNTFESSCNSHTFGYGCSSNSFGGACDSNSFGNECFSNTFGGYCFNNTFGNYCNNNTFGDEFQSNALGNDVAYIEIPTEKIFYTHILNGTRGTDTKHLTIEFKSGTTYSQFAGFTSDGVLKIWVESDDIVNITYNELKNLRDNSKLNPSQHYRITDFVTTVANDPEAQSAGHPFDIIVVASKENKLQEECYAIQHEGNTYFDNCNLAAWKIWYCLDNDNTKYAWADTVNGKGVIYRMIDEWQNDCPYDFKNVQFKRYAVADASSNGALADLNGTYIGYNDWMNGLNIPDQSNFKWMYTFSLHKEDGYVDYSSNGFHEPFTEDVGYFMQTKKGQCVYNTLSNTYGSVNIDGQFYVSLILNNIVLISEIVPLTETLDFPSEMIYNTFGTSNFNMTLKNNPESNKFDNECYDNIVDGYANTFGCRCSGNTFGSNCRGNTFGNNCESNSFGRGFTNNSFGNICGGNTFGIGCSYNTFGNDCNGNTFGNDCESNSFDDYCVTNTFGDSCYYNTFGNYCNSNTFGSNCRGNTFGNNCWGNSFEMECVYNSFGNNCGGNKFGNYFQNNALGNDVQYINIPTVNIYHTHILNGTKGTSSTSKLTITFTPQTKYSQFAGFTSDGVLETWVEADDSNGVDCGTY